MVIELAAAAQHLHQIQRLYLLVNVGLLHVLQGPLYHQLHLVQVSGKLALLLWVRQHLGAQLETGQRGLEIMGHGAEQQIPLVQVAANAALHLVEGMDGGPGLAAPLLLYLGDLPLAVEQGGGPGQVADGPYLLAYHPPGGDQDDQCRPQHETELARGEETGIQALVRGGQGRRQIEPGAGGDGNLDHQNRRIELPQCQAVVGPVQGQIVDGDFCVEYPQVGAAGEVDPAGHLAAQLLLQHPLHLSHHLDPALRSRDGGHRQRVVVEGDEEAGPPHVAQLLQHQMTVILGQLAKEGDGGGGAQGHAAHRADQALLLCLIAVAIPEETGAQFGRQDDAQQKQAGTAGQGAGPPAPVRPHRRSRSPACNPCCAPS